MEKLQRLFFENRVAMILMLLSVILIIIVGVVSCTNRNESDYRPSKYTSSTNEESSDETTENPTKDSESSKENGSSEDETSDETTIEDETSEEETTVTAEPVDYPYVIKVNRAANCTTVYGKDANGNYSVPVRAITVSCGKVITDTPLGEFNTIISYDWRLMFDDTYGHYAYRIVGSTLFHSVPYYTASNNDLEWEEYNKLGSPASLGCIRMTVADAKWLVDNCPIGTKVIIYDNAANPGPLGKPETIKIPANSPHKGWDPTDPHPDNPWHNFSAKITAPASKSVTVSQGSEQSKILSAFKAKDTCGNDISNKMILSGDFDLNKVGTYNNLKIKVTDALGRTDEVIFTLIVKGNEAESSTEEETTTEEQTTIEDPTSEENTEEESSEEITTGEETSNESTEQTSDETESVDDETDEMEQNNEE